MKPAGLFNKLFRSKSRDPKGARQPLPQAETPPPTEAVRTAAATAAEKERDAIVESSKIESAKRSIAHPASVDPPLSDVKHTEKEDEAQDQVTRSPFGITPSSDSLEAFMDQDLLQELSTQSHEFIIQFTRDADASKGLQLFQELNQNGTLDALKGKFDAVMSVAVARGGSIVSSVTSQVSGAMEMVGAAGVIPEQAFGAVEKILDGIGNIADTHPILKVTWFIVSAGYKMAKAVGEVEVQFQKLAHRFLVASQEISRLRSLKTKGIPAETSQLLSGAINLYIGCLVDIVKLYLNHLENSNIQRVNKVISAVLGFDSKKINEVNDRLDAAQKNLSRVKADGTLEILISVAANVVDTKEAVTENLDVSKKVLAVVEDMQGKMSAAAFDKELEVLRGHCQFTEIHSFGEISALTSKRNPKTRGWIIDQMVETVTGLTSTKKITWLRGEAGTGKSVISGCVASELDKRGVLGAAFFCQHDNVLRESVSAMIQTLSYELATKNEAFRKSLVKSLEDSKFKDKTTPTTNDLVTIFILNPFRDWPSDKPCAIIIDALDELWDHDNASSVLDAFQSLKKPVKLFLTSRPDVTVSIKGKKQFEIETFDVESDANKEDIRIFTHDRLAELTEDLLDVSSQDFEKIVNTLAEASKGLFIWITLVLGNVSGTEKFSATEDETLEAVEEILGEGEGTDVKETGKQLLERLEQSATLDLQSLYCRALFKAYPTSQLSGEFKIVAGAIMEAKVPLSTDTVSRLVSSFNGSEKLAKIRVTKTLKLLQSLLKTDKDGKLSFIHKTVYEYLSQIECHSNCVFESKTCDGKGAIHCCHNQASAVFKIDFDSAAFNMATACLAVLNASGSSKSPAESFVQNMGQIGGSVKHPSWDANSLSESLRYAVVFWSTHFSDIFPNISNAKQLELINALYSFCKFKLPYYLEALLLLGQLNDVSLVVSSITACLSHASESPETRFIISILNDLKFIAFNYRAQLLTSPIQVYKHVLVAVPQESEYFKTYNAKEADAKIVLGKERNWGPLSLVGHDQGIFAVALSGDGKTIASGSCDTTVKVWSIENGECFVTLEGHTQTVMSVAVSVDGQIVVSGSIDKTIKIWDRETGMCIKTLEGHSEDVSSVALSADGRLVVSGSGDKTIKLWSMETGDCVGSLAGHEEDITSVAISSDGALIASGSWDKTIRIWSVEQKKCIKVLEGHTWDVSSVTFSQDGKMVVSGSKDETMKVWSVESGECIKTLAGHTSFIYSVSISLDGKTIGSASSDETAKVWDSETGECRTTLRGHSSNVHSIALSPDGQKAITGSGDAVVKIWTIGGSEVHLLDDGHTEDIYALALSSDGKLAASGSSDETVRVWSAESGDCIRVLKGHTGSVFAVAFSVDGEFIASASYDKTVKLWSAETGECLQTFEGHTKSLSSVAISTDNKTLVSGASDKTLRVWSVASGECVKTLEGHEADVSLVALSPDGKTIVAESDDEVVKVWDIETGECIKSFSSQETSFASTIESFSALPLLSSVDNWILAKRNGQADLIFNLPIEHRYFVAEGKTAVWAEASRVFSVSVL